MNGPVGHFEIPADDVERASSFYGEVFGWNANAIPDLGYTILGTTPSNDRGRPDEPGAINGGMFKREGQFAALQGPVVTLIVEDIDAALAKVNESGGSTVMDKEQIGEMGFAAYFSDTEGNTMGLWQAA